MALEQRLADFHSAKHCVTFANAFWGLSMAMKMLALPGKHEVIIPSMTYRRMAEIVVCAGLIPRYCDVDADSLSQRAANVEAVMNDDTALIVGVHPTVNCCDSFGLEELSARTGIPLMFDSVESAFETLRGRRIGTFGLLEGFSVHASKLINGFEGGYITTNHDDVAERLSIMRGFGFKEVDTVVMMGFNVKLNEVHCAMAAASLDKIDEIVAGNEARYRTYAALIEAVLGLRLRRFDESEQTSFKNILVELTADWPLTLDETLAVLHAERALARPYYYPALHTRQTSFETRHDALPNTESLSGRFVLLPCGYQMSETDIESVMTVLRSAAQDPERIRGLARV